MCLFSKEKKNLGILFLFLYWSMFLFSNAEDVMHDLQYCWLLQEKTQCESRIWKHYPLGFLVVLQSFGRSTVVCISLATELYNYNMKYSENSSFWNIPSLLHVQPVDDVLSSKLKLLKRPLISHVLFRYSIVGTIDRSSSCRWQPWYQDIDSSI